MGNFFLMNSEYQTPHPDPPKSAVHEPWIWPNFQLIRDYIVVLVTCKNEEGPIKNEGARVVTTFLPS